LFEIKSTSSFNTDRLTDGDDYDYITRTSQNQGILRNTGFVNKKNINPAGTWSLGLLQMDFFYREKPWYAGQFVRKIIPKILIPEGAKLFFQTILNAQKHLLLSVLVRDVDKLFEKTKIYLPQTKDNKINFEFMEMIVHELAMSRMHELESYLLASGLNNCILTDSELSALRDFKNLRWKEFLMDDLFEKQKSKKLSYMAKELPKRPTRKFTLPCLTSSFMNQGLNYYAPRNGATILNNVISIPSNSDVYRAYYQPNDFTVLSDAYAISWKDESVELNEKQYLFLVTCINKVTNLPIYSYKNKLGGWEVVKNKSILLPVNANNQPDLVAMEQIISALQKRAIADVANYTKQNLDASKRVATLNTQYSGANLEVKMAAEPFECYKWEGVDKSICDFFGSDKTILIGCYKEKKYQDWIYAHNIYTIRLGNTKGSMEANRELFDRTSLLILYELDKPNKLSAYKIVGNKEIGKEELLAMDYPNKKPRKSYMTFSLVPTEMDLTFIAEHHLVERLIELNSENAKGTPVFIQP
jgi:hypothetical protein